MNPLLLALFFLLGSPDDPSSDAFRSMTSIYEQLDIHRPSWETFEKAFTGYDKISQNYELNLEKPYLTIIDLNLPSDKKRLWVIDLKERKILFNTYASHGKNSGNLYAKHFSNKKGSYQTSLGFYITGISYQGRNGYSMYLEGIEKNFNHRARERAIVMHGAWYATEKFILNYGRLGRSYGCPAIPPKIHKELIDTIMDRTVLFIYYEDDRYLEASQFLPH